MSYLILLNEVQSYTFRSYFEMPYETDEVLSEFDVSLVSKKLSLPRLEVDSSEITNLQADLEASLEVVELASETARREVLVAPVLIKVVRLSSSRLRIEYPLVVSEQLKGKLDYLVEGRQHLLVIEAKNDDLSRGFTQLAVELIALARREARREETPNVIYGAVTIGNAWLFGWFDIAEKRIYRDTSLYRVPDDLQKVMEILMGILASEPQSAAA